MILRPFGHEWEQRRPFGHSVHLTNPVSCAFSLMQAETELLDTDCSQPPSNPMTIRHPTRMTTRSPMLLTNPKMMMPSTRRFPPCSLGLNEKKKRRRPHRYPQPFGHQRVWLKQRGLQMILRPFGHEWEQRRPFGHSNRRPSAPSLPIHSTILAAGSSE